ncbi:MAG: hypothetical protein WD045_08300 [Pirellulaceae bacterium]
MLEEKALKGPPSRVSIHVIQVRIKRGLAVTCLLSLLLIAIGIPFQGPKPPIGAIIAIAVVALPLFINHFWVMYLLLWASLWRCPRCGNRFTWKGLGCNQFTHHCLHCGVWREEIKGEV